MLLLDSARWEQEDKRNCPTNIPDPTFAIPEKGTYLKILMKLMDDKYEKVYFEGEKRKN